MPNNDRIEFDIVDTELGPLLVAASGRGVCLVRFGSSWRGLRRALRKEFPFATFAEAGVRLRRWSRSLARSVAGESDDLDVPLDVRGSRFQRRVWDALRRIPRGETRSYAFVARAIGSPDAARAVGRACATNPVPLLVPCHRVIREDGSLGGYAFGLGRKRALLGGERAAGDDERALRRAASRRSLDRVSVPVASRDAHAHVRAAVPQAAQT